MNGNARQFAAPPQSPSGTGPDGTAARRTGVTGAGWRWRAFPELSVGELYAILRLRQEIFIVEQEVPYLDADGKDPFCRHLTASIGDRLVGCLRVVPIDLFAPGAWSLGRVVVAAELRGQGLGRELVDRGLAYLDGVRDGRPIRISSQLYLREFYRSFGFAAHGDAYVEDRIMHIAMIRH